MFSKKYQVKEPFRLNLNASWLPPVSKHTYVFLSPQRIYSKSYEANNSPYKNKTCLIRHDSLFKAVWDWVILVFVIYTTIEIPFDVAFLRPSQTGASTSRFGALMALSPIVATNVFADFLFIIDIPINFRSASIKRHSEAIISDPKEIAVLYLKSWFIVDFVSAIPFEFLVDPQQEGVSKSLINT